MKRFRIVIYVLLGLFILAIGSGIYYYGNHPQWFTAQKLDKETPKPKGKPKNVRQANALISSKKVQPDYSGTGGLSDKQTMLRLVRSNQNEILRGFVAMPSFNIDEPIYEGTSDHVLSIGAGLNEPNVVFGKGNVPIFAHNMGDYDAQYPLHPTKFSALQNMNNSNALGKMIYLSDGKTVFEYRASKLESGVPVSELNKRLSQSDNSGTPTVQLIACLEDAQWWAQVRASHYTDFHANKRIILTGTLVKSESIETVSSGLREQLQ